MMAAVEFAFWTCCLTTHAIQPMHSMAHPSDTPTHPTQLPPPLRPATRTAPSPLLRRPLPKRKESHSHSIRRGCPLCDLFFSTFNEPMSPSPPSDHVPLFQHNRGPPRFPSIFIDSPSPPTAHCGPAIGSIPAARFEIGLCPLRRASRTPVLTIRRRCVRDRSRGAQAAGEPARAVAKRAQSS